MSNNLIDQLKDAPAGDKFQISGKTLMLYKRLFQALWRGENIGNSPTVRKKSHAAAGFTLEGSVSASGAAAVDPFGVTLSTEGTSANPNRASVFWNSSLFKNEILNNTQSITGLATEAGATNAFPFIYGNDLIWVEVLLTSGGAISSATIKSYGQGGAWVPSDPPQEYGTGSGPFECQTLYDVNANPYYTQYILRRAIFVSQTSTTSPFPVINTQLLKTNLMIEGDVWNSAVHFNSGVTPVTVPFLKMAPFGGGYITV